MKSLLLAASLLAMTAAARAEDQPFIGKWDCEGKVMSFANDMYGNGSEEQPITEVQEGTDNSWTVFVNDETYVTLSDITADSMVWTSSEDSSRSLTCSRLLAE